MSALFMVDFKLSVSYKGLAEAFMCLLVCNTSALVSIWETWWVCFVFCDHKTCLFVSDALLASLDLHLRRVCLGSWIQQNSRTLTGCSSEQWNSLV